MDTRKVAAEYRLARWTQMLQERDEKGQSIQEFCEAESISRNRYFYWQRKVREAACASVAKVRGESLSPMEWTRLAAEERPIREAKVHIEVNGCRITATGETDIALLQRICEALRSIC